MHMSIIPETSTKGKQKDQIQIREFIGLNQIVI